MAQLTWRNVDAPNFSGAAAGYKAFSDLISNAGKTASDAIGTYDDTSRMDAANPGVQAYFQAAAQGNPNAAREALVQHAAAFGNLRADQLAGVLGTGGKMASTSLGNLAEQFKLGTGMRNDNDQLAATAVLNKIGPGIGNAQDVYPILRNSKEYNLLSPAAQRLVQQGVTGMGYQFQGPSAIGGASSLGSGSPATAAIGGAVGTPKNSLHDVVIGFGKYGSPDKPITQMTLGEAETFGNSLIDATRGKAELGLGGTNKGTSALGAFQIVNGTRAALAEKMFGKDWKSVKFTPEVQDAMAERLFNDSKDGNLKAVWTSLPNATPGAYKDKGWAEMRGIIQQGEVGGTTDPAAALAAAAQPKTNARKDGADSKNELQLRVAQDNAGGMANVFAAMEDTRPTPASIAAQWAKDKKFPGANQGAVVDLINDMVSKYGKYGVTANVAGAILENGGLTGATDWTQRLITNRFRAMGEWVPNDEYIGEQVNALKNGKTLVNASANQGTTTAKGMLDKYMEEQAAARTELSGLAAAARDRPELLDQAVPRAQRRLDAADAMLRQLSASQQSTSNLQPALDRPQPVATTVAGKAAPAIAAAVSNTGNAPVRSFDGGKSWHLDLPEEIRDSSVPYYRSIPNPTFAALGKKKFASREEAERAYLTAETANTSKFDDAVKKKVEIPQTSVSTGAVVGKVSPPTATPLNPEPTTTTRSSSVSLDTSKPSGGVVDAKTVSIPKVEWEPPQTLEQAMEDPSLLGSVADMRKHVLTFVPQKGVATKVTDGDGARVTLDNGTKLNCRIDSINAPETEKSFLSPPRPGQPVAEESKRYLQDLIENKQVTVRITRPAESGKNYSRDLCQISMEGKNVDVSMVQANMAYIYDRYVSNKNNTAHSRLFDLLQAKKQGMQTPSGVRALPSAEDPEKFNRRFQ